MSSRSPLDPSDPHQEQTHALQPRQPSQDPLIKRLERKIEGCNGGLSATKRGRVREGALTSGLERRSYCSLDNTRGTLGSCLALKSIPRVIAFRDRDEIPRRRRRSPPLPSAKSAARDLRGSGRAQSGCRLAISRRSELLISRGRCSPWYADLSSVQALPPPLEFGFAPQRLQQIDLRRARQARGRAIRQQRIFVIHEPLETRSTGSARQS